MSAKFYVTSEGRYLGAYDGVLPPLGAIEVPSAPQDARQTWDGAEWSPVPTLVPHAISRRQFFLQLARMGLTKSAIQAKIDQLPVEERVYAQIEFDEASTFARDNPFVVNLSASLAISPDQLDDAFRAAVHL